MNFGPLSNQGGERRLNVLMTRARWECRLFVSFDPSELRVENTGEGPKQLKQYLEFAKQRSHATDIQINSRIEPANGSFARALQLKLERAGLSAEEFRHGNGFCDLAVIDPKDRSRYALSVVLDGSKRVETLHGAALPDLLCALESNGWRTHIVSTEDLLYRSNKVVEEICKLVDTPAPAQSVKREYVKAQLDRNTTQAPPPPILAGVKPYSRAMIVGGIRLFDSAQEQLDAAIAEVVKVESPVHVDEVYFRLRSGERDRETWSWKFNNRLDNLIFTDAIYRKGDFLFASVDKFHNPIRDRSQFPSARKSIEFVYDQEIKAAMLLIVELSLGISREELAAKTLQLLGLSSENPDSLAQVTTQIAELIDSGELLEYGGFVKIVS
jgi:hypothetical protein